MPAEPLIERAVEVDVAKRSEGHSSESVMACMLFDSAHELASDALAAPVRRDGQLLHVQRAVELPHARKADEAALAGDCDDEVPARSGGFEFLPRRRGPVGYEFHSQFAKHGTGRDLHGRQIGEVVVRNSLSDRHVGHGASIRSRQRDLR